MLKYVETNKAPAAIGPYSQGIVVNGTAFFSGQIPLSPETGTGTTPFPHHTLHRETSTRTPNSTNARPSSRTHNEKAPEHTPFGRSSHRRENRRQGFDKHKRL